MFRSVDTHLLLSHLKHTPLNRQSFHYFNFYVRITALIHWRSPQFCQDSISHFFLLLLLVHNKQCLDVSLTPTSNCSISISFRFIHTHTHTLWFNFHFWCVSPTNARCVVQFIFITISHIYARKKWKMRPNDAHIAEAYFHLAWPKQIINKYAAVVTLLIKRKERMKYLCTPHSSRTRTNRADYGCSEQCLRCINTWNSRSEK